MQLPVSKYLVNAGGQQQAPTASPQIRPALKGQAVAAAVSTNQKYVKNYLTEQSASTSLQFTSSHKKAKQSNAALKRTREKAISAERASK